MADATKSTYSPIPIWLLDALEKVNWQGPAIPYPHDFHELLDALNGLIARASYTVQAKDGLYLPYTLAGITDTAEHFLLGPDAQIQKTDAFRYLVTLLEDALLEGKAAGLSTPELALIKILHDTRARFAETPWLQTLVAPTKPDLTTLPLEQPAQFAMSWTTSQDIYRNGYPRLKEFAATMTDADAATEQFWPTLASTALPYNLLVLQKLLPEDVGPYQNTLGSAWTAEYDRLAEAGHLYGIDMTIFEEAGLGPARSGETMRFTPGTMTLLQQDPLDKSIRPIAVYVADPQQRGPAQTFKRATAAPEAWMYALFAAKTSLTVYGIWLGHVYTLHIVTAAMQMTMLNALPETHPVYQLLAPQSKHLIAFDLLLLLVWSQLAPPTSINEPRKFLALANLYARKHDFFATDPITTLQRLKLDPADFTDPNTPDEPWNLYPNVQYILKLWQMTASYVSGVVDDFYPNDAAVAGDTLLARWISDSRSPLQGNVRGLPSMDSKDSLKRVLTSILYRINFHGMGRLSHVANPVLTFVPNYPPCLQSTKIPSPEGFGGTPDLLRLLPNTGTLGGMVSFYYGFGFTEPYEPLIPFKGPCADLFFDAAHPDANAALVHFRKSLTRFIEEFQPHGLQIGQWPRSVEL